jgi:hypothetical protein
VQQGGTNHTLNPLIPRYPYLIKNKIYVKTREGTPCKRLLPEHNGIPWNAWLFET